MMDFKNLDLSDHSEMKVTPNAKIVINTNITNNEGSGNIRRLRNQGSN